MALTNAERQKRHRERVKTALRGDGAKVLTAEQIADRDAVMADPIWPVPTGAAKDQMPRFLGWTRYEWSAAPEPMIDHFGMRDAWEGWQSERAEMQSRLNAINAASTTRAEAIVAEHGDRARVIIREGGQRALFRAYEADPTLGKKQRSRSAAR